MVYNVHVKRGDEENNSSLVRRFSHGAQSANVSKRAKKCIYCERDLSKLVRKKERLLKIKKSEEFHRLYRLGKIDIRRKVKK